MKKAQSILSTVGQTLQSTEVFGELLTDLDREFLIKNSLILPTAPGQILCRQNETNDRLYLLLSGEVEISAKNEGETIVLAKLHNGEMFGEVAALFNLPRIATAKTTQATVLLEIPSQILSILLDNNPRLKSDVYNRYRDRTVITTLRCVPFFNLFSDDALAELCQLAALIQVKQNEMLAVEGDRGKGLFAITTGVAKVFVDASGSAVNVALLREGEYFGERSLLTGEPYSASIVALTDMSLILLPALEFKQHIENKEELKFLLNVNSIERQKYLDNLRSLPDSKQDLDKLLGKIQDYLSR